MQLPWPRVFWTLVPYRTGRHQNPKQPALSKTSYIVEFRRCFHWYRVCQRATVGLQCSGWLEEEATQATEMLHAVASLTYFAVTSLASAEPVNPRHPWILHDELPESNAVVRWMLPRRATRAGCARQRNKTI